MHALSGMLMKIGFSVTSQLLFIISQVEDKLYYNIQIRFVN